MVFIRQDPPFVDKSVDPNGPSIDAAWHNKVDKGAGDAHDELANHAGDITNPHGVTAAQAGALTQAEADAIYKAIGYIPAWAEVAGKPTTFAPSAHKTSHATGGADVLLPSDIEALGQVYDEGALIAYAQALDFLGAGVIVSRNATTGRIEVTISGAAAGAASETAAGITEQATQAEVEAGTAGNLFATVARLKAELDRRLNAGTWTDPSLTSGWTNFSGEQPIQYRKSAAGIVTIRGLGAPGTFGVDAIVFTLPVGFRLAARERFIGATSPSGTVGQIFVQPDGRVVPLNGSTILSFSGISFEATQ